MKNRLLWVLLALLTAARAFAFEPGIPHPPELRPMQQQAQAAHLAADFLSRYHYKPVPLDDTMSEKIFDHYLKSLDSEKLFFLQADIDQWSSVRSKLGEAIVSEDLSIPFAIFNLYEQRVFDRFSYARGLLKEGFDFGQHESYQYSREKEPWPKSAAEVRELWRKRVKNDWLRLKLAGKDDKSIVRTLDKRYSNSVKRFSRIKSEEVFQSFMNAYTMAIEPHTNYMAPRAAEDFDISMKLSLIGIGAMLAEKDEFVTIRELTPGGPAALSGKLKAGDRIVGVAQGRGGDMTEIQGWRLDDAVALIRGAADSVVQLDILPAETNPDGKHKLVSLVRKKISLEEQAAKKSVLAVADGKTTHRIGVIKLPTFYQDVEARQKGDQQFKSATRDVARLLAQLKKEKVEGVLIDLRNNGGGSLTEAVELTGLFVGRGPVVQARDARGNISIEKDEKASLVWSGPLGVLINRGSASASEIFAAAIQDYGRGVVIGEPSFGKGTVQAMVDLDQIAKNDKPQFGELKLTIAQFFRVNGGTTQLRGVTPDILFPSLSDPEYFGESSFDNALPWGQIKAADYSLFDDLNSLRPVLAARHESRIMKNKDFQDIQEDIKSLKLQRQRNSVSLNEAERRKERDAEEAKRASRKISTAGVNSDDMLDEESASGTVVQDDGLQGDERDLTIELKAEKNRKKAKDVFLNEAVKIVYDEVGLLNSSSKLAARTKPSFPLVPVQKQPAEAFRGSAM